MQTNNAAAARILVLNCCSDATHILLIAIIAADAAGIDVVAGMMFGAALGAMVFLIIYNPQILLQKVFHRAVLTHSKDLFFGLHLISLAGAWPLFIIAANLIGPLSATIIFGLHTIVFVPFLTKIGMSAQGNPRWHSIGLSRSSWLVVAFVGLVLAVLAQHDGPVFQQQALWKTAGGTLLALLATGCASLSAVRFPLGAQIASKVESGSTHPHRLEATGTIWTFAVGSLLVGWMMILVGWPVHTSLLIQGSIIGVCGFAPGVLTKTFGCLLASNLSINSIAYATPLVTIALFAVTDKLGSINIWLLLCGAICVLVANLAIYRSMLLDQHATN